MIGIKKSKKIIDKKELKTNKLLETSFKLFTKKGINNTSVDDITKEAGIAKGTFYLYFKDKYDLQDYLIVKKSKQLFDDAIKSLKKESITDFKEKVIYIIDYIINKLVKNKLLIKFISRNLSWGVYHDKVNLIASDSELGLYKLFIEEYTNSNIKLQNPDITLYMIIELSSSTIYSCITNNKPLPINEFKPYLYKEIERMLEG